MRRLSLNHPFVALCSSWVTQAVAENLCGQTLCRSPTKFRTGWS